MTTTTFLADTGIGSVQGYSSSSYALARSGANVQVDAIAQIGISGQYVIGGPQWGCKEFFFQFDTSSIPDGATIQSVVFSLFSSGSVNHPDIFEARVYDFGSSVTTSDYVAGASLSGLTRLATFDTSTISGPDKYYDFTEDSTNFRTNINKTGYTRFLLCAQKEVSGTAPTIIEYWNFCSPDFTGTSQDPKLTVTYIVGNTYNQSVTGAMGSLVGTVSKKVSHLLSGSPTLSGIVNVRNRPVRLTGAMGTLSGVFAGAKVKPVNLTGAMGTLSGTMSRKIFKVVSGSPLFSGVLTKQGQPVRLSGSLSPTAVLQAGHGFFRSFSGAIPAMSGGVAGTYIKFQYALMRGASVIMKRIRGGSSS